MDEDLLVLLEPRVESGPLKAHPAGQPLQRIIGIHMSDPWTSDLASAKTVTPRGPAAQVLGVLLIDEHSRIDVRERDVVLRIIGPLPHVQSAGGVEHDRSAQKG